MSRLEKLLSNLHEDYIAKLYDGKRSPSSGAAVTDQGDVDTSNYLIECKRKGAPGNDPIRTPKHVKDFEKIADEAWSIAKRPKLALRYYLPTSILANKDGWVDIALTLVTDDAYQD